MRVYILAVLLGLVAAVAIDRIWFDGRYYTLITKEVGQEIKTILPR